MPKQSLNINKFIQVKDPSKAFVVFLLFLENPHRKSNGDTRISTDNEWKKDSRERLWKRISIFIVMKTFTSIQIFMQNHHFEFRFQWRRRHTTKGKVNNAIAVGGRRQKGIGLQKKINFPSFWASVFHIIEIANSSVVREWHGLQFEREDWWRLLLNFIKKQVNNAISWIFTRESNFHYRPAPDWAVRCDGEVGDGLMCLCDRDQCAQFIFKIGKCRNDGHCEDGEREIHKLRLNAVDLTRNTQFISLEINH